jgi:23S rRNA (cytidine1920-2'-O)/16S rRNA (cytidine1409-2'-O)-methyltransferase
MAEITFSLESGLKIKGLTYSPVKGPEGNIEYLLYLSKAEGVAGILELGTDISDIVAKAHDSL